jgi:hypothetical protein
MGNPIFPATFVEEAVFSPCTFFGTFIKNEVSTISSNKGNAN